MRRTSKKKKKKWKAELAKHHLGVLKRPSFKAQKAKKSDLVIFKSSLTEQYVPIKNECCRFLSLKV